MRITFVLPGSGQKPAGGYKVVYEYANGLVQRGHDVAVIHPAYLMADKPVSSFRAIRSTISRYVKQRFSGGWRPSAWFAVHPRVRLLWVPSLSPRFIPEADAIVATLWATAEHVACYEPVKGRKHYLIQHLETWAGPKERVMATWSLPLQKIVIARWLQDIASNLGQSSVCVPNGLDFNRFGCDVAIAQRSGLHVGMLVHDSDWKGSVDGIAALNRVKEHYPALQVELFGVGARPAVLPEWYVYHQNPPQQELRRLYNRCGIFVAPSWTEGWGLPPSEAMMCGAAVVATDVGGHREFAIHNQTALLSPPRHPEQLADNIRALVEDEPKRQQLAEAGMAFIQRFTWERAVDAMERLLVDGSHGSAEA